MPTYAEKNDAVAILHGEAPHGNAYDSDVNPYAAHQHVDDDAASTGNGSATFESVMPMADEHGHLVEFPVVDKQEEIDDLHDGEFSKELSKDKYDGQKNSHSFFGSAIESFKYLYSLALLIFSVAIVMAAIFTEQTVATGEKNMHPALAFVVFWCLIFWLALMEGGQGALVGLQPIDKELYADSHPRSLMVTKLVHKGENMERFIIGRQFLVVLVVFAINIMATSVKNADVLSLNAVWTEIFLNSGVAVILTTIMLGQLTAQVNASFCMLDFINNYGMLLTAYVSLAIETSGILHSVYLVQMFFARLVPKSDDSTSAVSRSLSQKIMFWGRVAISVFILGYSFAVTLSALFKGKTAMWDGVPEVVSVILLFVLMAFVGMMEGMQIAFFAVINLPESALVNSPVAYRTCQLVFAGDNLKAFLIGRQICVTVCMFVVARITMINVDVTSDDSQNIFGVSDGLQAFFNTGLLGAVITTTVASLMWRVIASTFPVAFLSNPIVYLTVRLCMILEHSGFCSASWIFARFQKPLLNFQPDAVHLEGAEPHTSEPVTRRDKDIDRLITVLKFVYSLGLFFFALIVVMASIFTEQTVATGVNNVHSIIAFFLFWFLICWLAIMEGGQGALVGLQPVDPAKYADSHPRSLKNCQLAHNGNNMERFIVGRQLLVVLVVFAINMLSSAIPSASVLGLPNILNEIFLASGLGVILVTITIGQLTAQVNAANCMLDFVNNYFMLFTTYVSLAIEKSGILHSVYLVQMIFSKVSGKDVVSKEPERSQTAKVFYWIRVVGSLGILGFSFAVTLSALFEQKTAMWDGVPSAVSVIVFFLLMIFVGFMEGMQIALFAVINLPEEEVTHSNIARANCQLVFRDQNLQAFLIGRQILVTICMFVVARVTNIQVDLETGNSENIFSVSDGAQAFFNTGLLGAIITTIVGSLIWRIIASSFPVAFLSNPLIYLIIRLCLILESSGVCSAAWVLGRFNKLMVGFQPDEVYLEGAEPHGSAPVTRRDKDVDVTVTLLKYLYSMGLLVFSVTVVMAAIFNEQTTIAENVSPVLAFFLIWGLILWLAMMEGGQGCLVGLQHVDSVLYSKTHPVSLISTNVVYKGDNMERFIVGRQFLVVLVVFLTNMCGGAIEGASVLGLSSLMTEIFLSSGVAMILMTIILGQLTAQVNAATCMLDFINNYFMVFTTYVSLAIEASGLLHAVYLVQNLFAWITGVPVKSNEPPRSTLGRVLFWARVAMSVIILGFSFAVTLAALFKGKTNMWDGIPEAVSVILLFVLMAVVGMMEGMQIALFALVKLPSEELSRHTVAAKVFNLIFSGNNLQTFLIGRQICVTVCMFVVARITSINVNLDEDENIFGVSDGLQNFFNTGLLGAVITTLVGSLAWRIIASAFPVAFLSNPLIYLIIRMCMLFEGSGICSAAWLLAQTQKSIFDLQHDEVYIGTPEERAAAALVNDPADDDLELATSYEK